MRVERPLRPVAHACGNLEVVADPDTGDPNHAVHILNVAFNLAANPVRMVRDLANCQGP